MRWNRFNDNQTKILYLKKNLSIAVCEYSPIGSKNKDNYLYELRLFAQFTVSSAMIYKPRVLIFFLFLWMQMILMAQRVYVSNSVLASGLWYKVAIKDPGVYKVDLAFLSALGFNVSNLSSSSIRLFGNGGGMLSEANADIPIDDLQENAIMVVDGGDGIFNGNDYFLFYANGPDQWLKDSVNKKFTHRKNIYSDSAYYFITIGGTGKRINSLQLNSPATATVNTFNERIFHEQDMVNLLNSGKSWFGEEFSDAPGKSLTKTFSISLPGLQTGVPVTLVSDCIARSINSPGRFDVRINNQLVQQIHIAATGAGLFDNFAQQAQQISSAISSQENLQLTYTFVPGGFNAQGWLNWYEIHCRSSLRMPASGKLLFRDWNSVGNNMAEFVIANATGTTQVWDITDPHTPVHFPGNYVAGELRFRNDASRLREYIAFNPANALVPVAAGKVPNQNLHNIRPADYLIVTHPSLLPQAERLATFHRQKNNLRVTVVTTAQIFNEFSSGTPDVSAIRNFVKMYYDKFAASPADRPRYLLLFGDASFDYKNRINNNSNLVLAYQSAVSLDPLSTYTSDDFFGFLDDQDDINSGAVTNLLDIRIGRIPAKNKEEAKNYVDKVEAYFSPASFGAWRTNLVFIADDEDNNLHLDDAELVTATAASTNPLFNIQKIYLDAYRQQSGAGGSRYPQVNETINNRILNGTLMINYNGHGGATRLAEEAILDQSMINSWNNLYRLPLFITATCDFAPFDNPFIPSIGENILLRPRSGGIALMTTTRLVFSYSNRIMNNNYIRFALETDSAGRYRSLGEAALAAKNFTYQTSGDIINNRKFTLLGDPALTLAFPKFKIKTTKINSVTVPGGTDTLSAGEKTVIEGELTDNRGVLLGGFNGTVYTTVFDKIQTMTTLANDAGSMPVDFQQLAPVLFRGKASVTGGRFRIEFKMPRDINYQFGNGRISYYAEDGTTDGSDYFTEFKIGGLSDVMDSDRQGPEIKAWLNDEKFVNGSIVNQRPVLILKLTDTSGINVSGSGIGHDLTATLDQDNNVFFLLNEYFESDLDNYRQGKVRYQLPELKPGPHSIKIKAWDALSNSSEKVLDFVVSKDEALVVDHVLNYPNPFTTKTQFWFEHNKPGQDLHVQVQILTISGRVIKTIEKTINNYGNRSSEVEWDGRDEFGDKVARGVYIYKLRIHCQGSKPQTFYEKLVVF